MTQEASLKKYLIIVAGGAGARMNLPIPKQFTQLLGKPIILHSITPFIEAYPDIEVIIGVPKIYVQSFNDLAKEHSFDKPYTVVEGGESRFHTVKNCLETIKESGIVGIHDAARPLVSVKTIIAGYKAAEMYGSAVPAIPLYDSIRQIDSALNIAVDRSKYCLIQTPQCFRTDIIQKAYKKDYKFTFTDDASVVESTGEKIHLVDGHSDNIKITTPRDLVIAEALMKNRPVTTPHNKLKLSEDLNILKPADNGGSN